MIISFPVVVHCRQSIDGEDIPYSAIPLPEGQPVEPGVYGQPGGFATAPIGVYRGRRSYEVHEPDGRPQRLQERSKEIPPWEPRPATDYVAYHIQASQKKKKTKKKGGKP